MEQHSKPFPVYQLMDAFEAFTNGEPDVKPQHRSLYYFLVGYARKRGNVVRFNMPYENGMHGSGIGSWATYDAALKALAGWGFIVYTPGANRFKVPVIELTFRNPTDDVLLTYWQSYCISTANSTDDVSPILLVTLKRELEIERKRVEELERLREQHKQTHLSEAASLRSAVAGLESELEIERGKVRQLEEKLSAAPATENNAQASRTKGGRRGAAEEPAEFARFYEAYPRKEKRQDALSAWRGLTADEQATAYDLACEWFRLRPDLADPARHQYIPLPASWLRGKRWKDQPPTQRITTHVTASANPLLVQPRPTGHGYARAESRLDIEAAVSFAGALAVGGSQPGQR